MKNQYLLLFLIIFLLSSCGGSPVAAVPTATGIQGPPTAASAELPDRPADTQESDSPSGLPTDVETYYKTMVFIEGTAQIMGNFDLTTTGEAAGILPLMSIPGVMDNRVIETEETPLPDGLAPAWEKALEASDRILGAFENLMMVSITQDEFIQQLDAIEALASEAVAETEAIAASDYGATTESIALANRAALTEMGEAYQSLASMMLMIQSQSEENSE